MQTWTSQAEVAVRFLKKGDPVAIEGELRTEQWKDTDGNPRSKTFVRCSQLHLIGSKSNGVGRPDNRPNPAIEAPDIGPAQF